MPVLNPMLTAPEPPPVKRYYGRNRGKDSDSELSLDSDGSEEEQTEKIVGHKNGKNGSKGPTAMKVSMLLIIIPLSHTINKIIFIRRRIL